MKLCQWICGVAILLVAITAHGEDGWFAGVAAGTVDHEFEPEYTFTYDRGNTSYRNESDGTQIDLVGGYRQEFCPHFSADYLARYSWSDSEWELSLPEEPAAFSYNVEHALSVSVRPVIRLHRYLEILLEAGLQRGLVQEKKSSSTRSSYDYDEWTTGYLWGYGIGSQVTDRISILAEWRTVSYDEFVYKSYLPDGSHRETIQDEPTSESFTIAVLFSL